MCGRSVFQMKSKVLDEMSARGEIHTEMVTQRGWNGSRLWQEKGDWVPAMVAAKDRTDDDPRPLLVGMKWGTNLGSVHNARLDTILDQEKQTWKKMLDSRCVFPLLRFSEGAQRAYHFASESTLWAAGIYRWETTDAGARVPCAAMLTCEAGASFAAVHKSITRMPLFMPQSVALNWINSTDTTKAWQIASKWESKQDEAFGPALSAVERIAA